jgi:hypothetical protein
MRPVALEIQKGNHDDRHKSTGNHPENADPGDSQPFSGSWPLL